MEEVNSYAQHAKENSILVIAKIVKGQGGRLLVVQMVAIASCVKAQDIRTVHVVEICGVNQRALLDVIDATVEV